MPALAVASDSETERVSPKKRSSQQPVLADDDERQVEEAVEADEEVEEEYEIEAVLEAKAKAFPGDRWGYLVKWKGYDPSHNSWVDEVDAENAAGLIEKYWEKEKSRRRSMPSAKKPKAGRKSAAAEEPPKKKRGRPSAAQDEPMDQDAKTEEDSDAENKPRTAKRAKKAAAASSSKKKRTGISSDPDELSLDDIVPMDKWMHIRNWEELIESIDTMERDEDNKLNVFFTLYTGEHAKEKFEVCKGKFPNKLFEFFIEHLRWKGIGEPPSD